MSNNSQDWDMQIKDYFVHRHALSRLGFVVLLYDRPVIPQALRHDILQQLHAGHEGCNMMFSRASSCLYWPHYREDINKFQASCKTCRLIASSNPSQVHTEHQDVPTYPFEGVVADFFSIEGRNYLAMVDIYSNWLSVFMLSMVDSANLTQVVRDCIAYF